METDKVQINIVGAAIMAVGLIELAALAMPVGIKFPPMMLLGLVRLIELALLLLVVVKLGNGLQSIGLGGEDLLPGLKNGLVWSAVFGAVVALGFTVLVLTGVNPLKFFASPIRRGLVDLSLLFIVGGLIAPLVEEVMFRGILYGYFRRWGIAAAILISSSIFVLLHAVKGVPVPQIVGGVVFALAYEFTGSLVTPVIIHILGNLAIFSLSLTAHYWL
jgi:membrane protease YdiL (CAAX protease family)